MDRACKDVDSGLVFRGTIPKTVLVNRSESGGYSICMNCAEKKTPPGSGADQGKAQASAPSEPLGDLLACDLTVPSDTYFSGGALVFLNRTGFDADGDEYGMFPVGGPSTATYLVGPLLLVANLPPDSRESQSLLPGGFQLAQRRFGATFMAPLGGGGPPPRRVRDADSPSKQERELARSHHHREADWGERYPTAFIYQDGTAKNSLMDSLSLVAASREDFLLAVDLRKIESKQASYFWAPFLPRQSVHLDENSLTVEGSGEDEDGYQPVTFVDYPYLIVIGEYAKLRLAPKNGGPESTLVVGFCDECP